MPTYGYKCRECGHTFEEFHSMSADALLTCPSCGKQSLVRLLDGGGGMIFKGSGFYITDYRKTSSSPSTSPSKSDSSQSDKKPTADPASDKSKSDPKPSPPSTPDSSKPDK